MLRRQKFTTFGGIAPDDDEPSPQVKELLNNNQHWIDSAIEKDPDFLDKLSRPQEPKYLYIGCSDSRVPANEILGLGYVAAQISHDV
jgi:hypothetical protein